MLKELYHGKINRSEWNICSEIIMRNQEWLRLSAEFEEMLTPEQVDMYRRLSDLQSENAALDNEALYVQGFKATQDCSNI